MNNEAISQEPTKQISPEDAVRLANNPFEILAVTIGLVGQGKKTSEIVSLFVDAKIEDSQLPEGVDRESLKKGIVEILGQAKKFWKLK